MILTVPKDAYNVKIKKVLDYNIFNGSIEIEPKEWAPAVWCATEGATITVRKRKYEITYVNLDDRRLHISPAPRGRIKPGDVIERFRFVEKDS